MSPLADVLRLGQQIFLVGLLAGRFMYRPVLIQGIEGAGVSFGVNADTP